MTKSMLADETEVDHEASDVGVIAQGELRHKYNEARNGKVPAKPTKVNRITPSTRPMNSKRSRICEARPTKLNMKAKLMINTPLKLITDNYGKNYQKKGQL